MGERRLGHVGHLRLEFLSGWAPLRPAACSAPSVDVSGRRVAEDGLTLRIWEWDVAPNEFLTALVEHLRETEQWLIARSGQPSCQHHGRC
jgi:hypothetical protein